MKYDLMIVGPATRDVNIDYTGTEDRCAGGAVTFCTPAALAAGAKTMAAVKIAPEDRDILENFRMPAEDIALLPSAYTTLMRNEYFTPDRERRHSSCARRADPVLPGDIPAAECGCYHLAGLLYGDFPGELLEALSEKGKLAADAQGFLRHRGDNGEMFFRDWTEKKKYLPLIDVLKTDAAEAEILTGLTDREAAAKTLFELGAGEVLISHNTEMLVFDGCRVHTCPVKARNLSGRTGRGDTTTGAYLARRLLGDSVEEALLYATACVSLKMETPGVFRGTRADVEDYIRRFYA